MMATCGKCGYSGPFAHGCGPSASTVSLLPRIADLEAENARLQTRVEETERERDDFRSRLKLEQASFRTCDGFLVAAARERDRYKASAERRGEALKPFALYHQAHVQAAPRTAAKDSSIPVLSYGKVHLGDKHFREAHAALVPEEEGR